MGSLASCNHGASHEEGCNEGGGHEEVRDEEGGGHEVDEVDEGEARERDRQGQGGQGACLLREEGEDAVGPHEGEAHEEQAWEGRVQESVRAQQEELGSERREGVVGGCEEGAEGARLDRVRRDRRKVCGGQSSLCEGEVLAVSVPPSSSTGSCRSEASQTSGAREAW